jgi:16S rRNA G1207 methylase RsmC
MIQGFDNRIVSYEEIHSIDPEDFKKLIDAIDPKSSEAILDAMCGYGAVGKAILEKAPKANVFFLDESEMQIKRAKENVPQVSKKNLLLLHCLKIHLITSILIKSL